MANPSVAAQVLSLIGFAAVAGGVHSLVVPVHLARANPGGGIVIPGGGPAPIPAPEAEPSERPTEPVNTRQNEPAAPAQADGKIDLTLAAQLHEKAMTGEPIWFLDARRAEDFEAGRIAGALHMSHSRLSGGDGLDELMTFAPPGGPDLLVIYCTGGDCEASEDSAILLEAAGYTNIAIMADGYDDWVAAGLPVEGATP